MFKKAFLLSVSTLTFLFGFSTNATACSCIDHKRPLLAEYANSKGVFVGKVASVTDIPKQIQRERDTTADIWVTFKIETAYKGIVAETKLITLDADYKGSSCGFRVGGRQKPRVGQRWIVFGYGSSKSQQLQLGAQCTKSRVIDSEKDLLAIKKALEKSRDIPGIAVGIVDYSDFVKKVDVMEVAVEGDGFRRSAEADENGIYHFPSLQPGKYSVFIKLPGTMSLFLASERFPKSDRATNNGQLILSYDVDLKEGEYDYNEVQINSRP